MDVTDRNQSSFHSFEATSESLRDFDRALTLPNNGNTRNGHVSEQVIKTIPSLSEAPQQINKAVSIFRKLSSNKEIKKERFAEPDKNLVKKVDSISVQERKISPQEREMRDVFTETRRNLDRAFEPIKKSIKEEIKTNGDEVIDQIYEEGYLPLKQELKTSLNKAKIITELQELIKAIENIEQGFKEHYKEYGTQFQNDIDAFTEKSARLKSKCEKQLPHQDPLMKKKSITKY